MMNLTKITDHATAASGRLLQQFQTGGQLQQLVEVIGGRYQSIEDAAYAMIAARYLTDADGATLEHIGDKVGASRPTYGPASTSDDAYRVLIYGKIAELVSYGTIPDLYNLLRALELTNVRIFQIYPASLTINFINNSLTLSCGCIRSILEAATPPVALDISMHGPEPFGFEGDSEAYGFDAGDLGATA